MTLSHALTYVMSPKERSQEVVEMLSFIEDKDEKLQFVIDKGKSASDLPEDFKCETFRIEGCVSNLWLVPEFKDGRIYYRADADAVITKGIAALLVDVYSDSTPQDILDLDPEFLAQAGITQHLTPNRRNGLSNVCKRIMDFARSCA